MVVENEKIIIFNSSPLINLAKIDRLDLIEKIYTSIIIPQAVYDEVVIEAKGREGAKEIKNLASQDVINVEHVKNKEIVKAFNKDLDYGESEVIALGLELNSDLLIIDESDARSIAEIYDLDKSGFIGLLIKAKNEGYIDSVKEYLDLVIEEGFRISKKLYNVIVNQVETTSHLLPTEVGSLA